MTHPFVPFTPLANQMMTIQGEIDIRDSPINLFFNLWGREMVLIIEQR
jgi:hypothetical protein